MGNPLLGALSFFLVVSLVLPSRAHSSFLASDIISDVPADLLAKYKIESGAILLAEDQHKGVYEDLKTNFDVEYVAGGATQNSIRVAQWMMQTPKATTFLGSVGADCDFGKTLAEAAARDGVATLYHESSAAPTGTCAVLVSDGGERSLIANLAAANEYQHSHTETKVVQDAITKAKIYYTASFFLTVPQGPQTMLHVAEHALAENKIFTMNLSAPFLIQFFKDPMNDVIPYADYIFANETEAAAFGEAMKWGDDLEVVAKNLAAEPKKNEARPRAVVFTQGADKTIVAVNGAVTTYDVPKLDPKLIKDTNGAGDAFVGGFLSKLAVGATMKECVDAGHYAAREVIQRSGCTFPDAAPNH